MIGYIPEVIYKAVKNDEEYKKLVSEIDEIMNLSKMESLSYYEIFSTRANFTNKNGLYYSMISRLDNIIKRICPEFYLTYQITYNGINTEKELEDIYNDKSIDKETRFFAVSTLANISQKTNSHNGWHKKAIEMYENEFTPEDRKSCSGYINLKIFNAKCIIAADSGMFDIKSPTFVDDFSNYISECLDECMKYEDNYDTICKVFMDASTDAVRYLMHHGATKDIIVDLCHRLIEMDESRIYQYEHICFGKLCMLDILADTYLTNLEFVNFLAIYKRICDMINVAYDDIPTALKSMNYYDKDTTHLLLCMIRKYIKIYNRIPKSIINIYDLKLNVVDEDKEFVLGNMIIDNNNDDIYIKAKNDITSMNRNSIDTFINNCEALEMLATL